MIHGQQGQGSYSPLPQEVEHAKLIQDKAKGLISLEDFYKSIFSTPIVFYGQVVDMEGKPVEAATVTYIPSSDLSSLAGKSARYTTLSDSRGMFTISTHGMDLYVSVSKDGYRPVQSAPSVLSSSGAKGGQLVGSAKRFEYFNSKGRPELNHHPESGSPVRLVLRKIGKLEPLIHGEFKVRLQPDGTPKTWSLHAKGSPLHQVTMVCRSGATKQGTTAGYAPFDWEFEMKVEKGGILEQTDEGFEAPESGYVPSLIIASMKASAPRWLPRFDYKTYYIRFDDGVCARIQISGNASFSNVADNPFVGYESYLNPNPDSRSLETK